MTKNHHLERTYNIFHSIRFRLALWFVLILAIVMLLFSAFIVMRQVQDLRAVAVTRLEMKARRLGIFFRPAGPGALGRPPGQTPPSPFDNDTVLELDDELAFINLQNQVLQNIGPASISSINQVISANITGQNSLDAQTGEIFLAPLASGTIRKSYVFMAAPVTINNQPGGYLLLGTPVDPNNQITRLLVSLSIGMLITLTIALIGGFWLADRAMRPVKQITQTARSIGETDLSLRLNLNQKDEIGELADTFDAMLARLQAAFEHQRQFTADASHELRTPLTIVELEAGRALAATRSPQEYNRALQVIQSENRFMTRLVNNLLTLARMDAGQVVLQKQPLDLSDLTLEVVERLEPLARKDQVRLSTGELPELPIQGDRQFLMQMLNNLVENAIKYSCGDGKVVSVDTGWRDNTAGKQVWVHISDNGPGIPEEHIPHLFDRFYQVDRARTKQDQDDLSRGDQAPSGAGLGLSIAQWIVEAHDGEIRVESELGKGTTFEVVLPVMQT